MVSPELSRSISLATVSEPDRLLGILEHIKNRQGNLIEIEQDKVYKEKLKKMINELLEIPKH
jgi:hypothetical protein